MRLTRTVSFRISKDTLKEATRISKELGLPLSAYCRMSVINSMRSNNPAQEKGNDKLR